MPSLIRRVAGAGVGMLAAVSLVATPSSASTDEFAMVNSASYLAGPLPRGSLVSIFTPTKVSAEQHEVFTPWTQTAPDGLYVEASCWSHDSLVRLPILYVGWSGTGTQLNLYYPNSTGMEPWGTCADSGPSKIVVHPAPGWGPAMNGEVTTLRGHPGIFGEDDAPAGTHTASGLELVRVSTGANRLLDECT